MEAGSSVFPKLLLTSLTDCGAGSGSGLPGSSEQVQALGLGVSGQSWLEDPKTVQQGWPDGSSASNEPL